MGRNQRGITEWKTHSVNKQDQSRQRTEKMSCSLAQCMSLFHSVSLWVRVCLSVPLGKCSLYSESKLHQRDVVPHMQMAGRRETEAELQTQRHSAVYSGGWLTGTVGCSESVSHRWRKRLVCGGNPDVNVMQHGLLVVYTLLIQLTHFHIVSWAAVVQSALQTIWNTSGDTLLLGFVPYTHLEWQWSGLIAGSPVGQRVEIRKNEIRQRVNNYRDTW